MSWRVANTCAERKFGSATRKQIIMFLADKASDDGSGIWCSKGTIQRHTELGDLLPVLDVGEALVVGDASLLPTRVRVRVGEPRYKPNSATIDFWDRWAGEIPESDIAAAVLSWRRQSAR